MGFPAVVTTNTTADSAATTSHTVNLPATIQNGDLLVLFLATVTTSPGTTTATGWTFLAVAANGTSAFLQVGYKHAVGTEGATVTVATTGSMRGAWISYRISANDYGAAPPQGTAATGSSTNPPPPALTPAWGAWDTLWIVCTARASATVATVAPAGFSGLLTIAAGTNSNQTAWLASRTATETPGSFTAVTAAWVTQTVAVKPVANPLPGGDIESTAGGFVKISRTIRVVSYH